MRSQRREPLLVISVRGLDSHATSPALWLAVALTFAEDWCNLTMRTINFIDVLTTGYQNFDSPSAIFFDIPLFARRAAWTCSAAAPHQSSDCLHDGDCAGCYAHQHHQQLKKKPHVLSSFLDRLPALRRLSMLWRLRPRPLLYAVVDYIDPVKTVCDRPEAVRNAFRGQKLGRSSLMLELGRPPVLISI